MKTIRQTLLSLLLTAACTLGVYAQENQSYILHTIEKGQSLYSISSMYGVSQNDIIRLNPGSEQRIYVGRKLRIPRKAPNAMQETFHTIESGETLYRLSVNYGVSVQAICKANPGLSVTNFHAGEVIRIPAPTITTTEITETQPEDTISLLAEVKPRCRDMHKVGRRETVYSISREYGISEEELIAANPELKEKNKIKRGTFLCIPYPQPQKKEKANPRSQETPTNRELFKENSIKPEQYATLKAAVILPLLPENGQKNESARMIEYYEGFLMAVDSLKKEGVSIDLYTYNSGSQKASIQNILANKALQDVNIIFGPLYQEHIRPLTEFAKQKGIRLVIPFTSKDNSVFRNPYIYQINTPQSYLYSEVYDHFFRQFQNPHVIFLNTREGTHDKQEFIKGFKEELTSRSIPTTTLPDTVTAFTLNKVLQTDRENIFVPTSGSNVTLIRLLPHLTVTVRQNPDATIHLFGYPEWQTYTKDHLDAFFELDTYFYSSFYTNNLLPSAAEFTRNYRHWFAKDMEERYPKYGILGFDTGYFFLKGLSKYGTTFEENLNKFNVASIQTGFKFQRVNNWGGFINRKVFFVHFTKSYELIKLDFD